MQAFQKHTGRVLPLERINVDTDQIIPKQFLKRIERQGFGAFLFYDWRFHEDGSLKTDFELNRPEYQGASILLAGENFGCGSSREHAPWALLDYGFRCILAPSFADIFYNNCFKNGLLPICLSESRIEELFQQVRSSPDILITVDLETCSVTDSSGKSYPFEVDDFRRRCLLEGLDDISLTEELEQKIAAYEASHPSFR